MNQYATALLLSTLCSMQLSASRDDCFHRYPVKFTNRSGGIADVKRTKGITGASRNTELANNESLQLLVQQRGAEIEVKAGPESNKTNRKIPFYSKDFRAPQPGVTLNPKGFSATGFSQKPITYNVKIENHSGGTARIIDTCATTGSGSAVTEGKTISLTVKPSSYIVAEFGPENQKIKPKIIFGEQTGEHPLVTLEKRGFTSRGFQHRDLDILGKRIPLKTFTRKKQEQRTESAKKIRVKKVRARKKRSNKALTKEL